MLPYRAALPIALACFCSFARPDSLSDLETTIDSLHAEGAILAIQIVAGSNDEVILERSLGLRSPNDKTPVDANTQFCIGSCSKPFAAATLLSLVQSGELDLDEPIDAHLPEFGNLKLANADTSIRAPNLRELLSHRAGIYSQKLGMNRRQARWIRDFTLDLEGSVKGISKEALIFEPGTDYAYSGAGYCVVGRVAEAALSQPFETIFQKRVARPLDLERTTYFPSSEETNVATGSIDGNPNKATPHLSRPFQLPLIGGSLYSTARDSAKFLQWIAMHSSLQQDPLLDPEHYRLFTTAHFKGKAYGLGWSFKIHNRKIVELSHTGALASSRATFKVNLSNGNYVAALYTLTHPKHSAEVGRRLNGAIARFSSNGGSSQ